jgi:hypothetical protein
MGSISIQAWTLACAAVILLVSDALVAVVALVMGGAGVSQKGQKEPMKVPAGQEKAGAKKEL